MDFIADDNNTWIANRLNIEGWTLTGTDISTGAYQLSDSYEAFETVILNHPCDVGCRILYLPCLCSFGTGGEHVMGDFLGPTQPV